MFSYCLLVTVIFRSLRHFLHGLVEFFPHIRLRHLCLFKFLLFDYGAGRRGGGSLNAATCKHRNRENERQKPFIYRRA